MSEHGPQNSPWFIVMGVFLFFGGIVSYLIWGPNQTANDWAFRSAGIGLAAAVVVGVLLLRRIFRR